MIKITVDGNEIAVEKGTTVKEAAELVGVTIPTLCYHDNLTANGVCRLCAVDTGGRILSAACVTDCSDGMQVFTSSARVTEARRTILELLASTVDLSEAPTIVDLIADHRADITRFEFGETRAMPELDDNPFFVRDYGKCVNCWRCVQACGDDAQYAFALSFDGRGFSTVVGTFMSDGLPDTTCVFCGQCVGVCPTNALKPKREIFLEQGMNAAEMAAATRGSQKKLGKRRS